MIQIFHQAQENTEYNTSTQFTHKTPFNKNNPIQLKIDQDYRYITILVS